MYSRQEALIASIMAAADEAGLLTDPPIPSEPDAVRSLFQVAIPRQTAILEDSGSTPAARRAPASLMMVRRRLDGRPLGLGRTVALPPDAVSVQDGIDGGPDTGGPDLADLDTVIVPLRAVAPVDALEDIDPADLTEGAPSAAETASQPTQY